GLVYCSGGLSREYTVLAVCQMVHCASGLSFLRAVCLIREKLAKGEELAEQEEDALHLGLLFRMFMVDRIEVRGTMHGVQENGVALDEEQLLFLTGGQDNDVDEDMDEQPVSDLVLNMDNVFQEDYDDFDSNVGEAPTAQTMFIANLSSAYPIYDEADPSYDSDILSKYVKDNAVPVVQSNVSSVPNDAYMMTLIYIHEQLAQHVFVTIRNNVVDKSLVAELATYKEQVKLYKRRAKFELTEREQKIDKQLTIVITDRNIKEENQKKELHSVKTQLTSTINHKKSMPSLYSGHEIIKTNHVPAIVHNSEETIELAEITRKKMNENMKDPECVQKKVKIVPHDYSKKNYLATFTPKKQLTPEQIFWSKDLFKMKAEALKEQTMASRSTKSLMVYTPNTPATLIPRHDEIKQKNILIANENLIIDCLSKVVFYTTIDFVLTVSRFFDMHEALSVAQKRIAELESENFNLKNKIQNDDHDAVSAIAVYFGYHSP
nr:hypothetical protein [Tanacetum cinerariifolium]